MRNMINFIIILSLICLLTGCWGAKKIEGEVYVTAIGFDYRDGKFIVYIQGLNFGNIAKQEITTLEEFPALIGEAKGESIHTAYGTLEQKTSLPLNLGHVETIILSERVIREKMAEVIDIMGQSPNLRYNIFLFGTDENIKDLLQTQSFFNYPQLYSVLYRPDDLIRQNYSLPIIRYHQFTSRYYRPIGTILIPSLTIDPAHFSEKKGKKVPIINGEYILSNQRYKGWVSKKDLSGMRWFSKGMKEFTLRMATKTVGVRIKNPKTKIITLKGKQPAYQIVVKGNAALFQNTGHKSNSEMEKVINKKIKHDILSTIKKGERLHTDILNISEDSFKYHLNRWDIETIQKFNTDSIKGIKVHIKIMESGKYKE